MALQIPCCHHEKWDGTGYARGLQGNEIPLEARIFSVVDVWNAICSDRSYHRQSLKPRWLNTCAVKKDADLTRLSSIVFLIVEVQKRRGP